jgi:hypothetical protein
MNSREAAQNYTDLIPLLTDNPQDSTANSGTNSTSNTALQSPVLTTNSKKRKSKSQDPGTLLLYANTEALESSNPNFCLLSPYSDDNNDYNRRSASQEVEDQNKKSDANDSDAEESYQQQKSSNGKRKRGSNSAPSSKANNGKRSKTNNSTTNAADEAAALAAESGTENDVSSQSATAKEAEDVKMEEVTVPVADGLPDSDDEKESSSQEQETPQPPRAAKSKSSKSNPRNNPAFNTFSSKSQQQSSNSKGNRRSNAAATMPPPPSPPLKMRQINPRTTMNEMRKRVKQLSDYIVRFQVSLAEENTSETASISSSTKENENKALGEMADAVKMEGLDGPPGNLHTPPSSLITTPSEDTPLKPKQIEASMDILDRLQRRLHLFQEKYGGFRGRM